MNVALELINSHNVDVDLMLEPWGEIYRVAPGAAVEVWVSPSPAGCPKVKFGERQITVYGWVGSVIEFRQNGRKLEGSGRVEKAP